MNDEQRPENKNSDFAGFTAPANVPGQAESRASKAQIDAWLDSLEERDRPSWWPVYEQLLAERVETTLPGGKPRLIARWDWRKALYIAWRCIPPSLRQPRYESELADLLGLSNTRTIRTWREKDPEIEQRIAEIPAAILMDHASAVLSALVAVASDPDPKAHQDRKLFLEMTGHYRTKSSVALMGDEDGGPIVLKVVYDDRDPDQNTEGA